MPKTVELIIIKIILKLFIYIFILQFDSSKLLNVIILSRSVFIIGWFYYFSDVLFCSKYTECLRQSIWTFYISMMTIYNDTFRFFWISMISVFTEHSWLFLLSLRSHHNLFTTLNLVNHTHVNVLPLTEVIISLFKLINSHTLIQVSEVILDVDRIEIHLLTLCSLIWETLELLRIVKMFLWIWLLVWHDSLVLGHLDASSVSTASYLWGIHLNGFCGYVLSSVWTTVFFISLSVNGLILCSLTSVSKSPCLHQSWIGWVWC